MLVVTHVNCISPFYARTECPNLYIALGLKCANILQWLSLALEYVLLYNKSQFVVTAVQFTASMQYRFSNAVKVL